MTLQISAQPIRLLISGGLAGPAGASVNSVTADTQGRLVFTLADGTTLPPVSLPTSLTLSTIDGQSFQTVDGVELGRII